MVIKDISARAGPSPIPGANDRGLLLSDGLFETLLYQKGNLIALEAHVGRLQDGCATLGLPAPSIGDMATEARAAIHAAGLTDAAAAVRVTWTAGAGGRGLDRPTQLSPRLFATASPAPKAPDAVRLCTVDIRRNEYSPTSRLKSLAYLDNVLARRAARSAGGDEALLLNSRGRVACAAAANLFWIEEEQLVTPSLECGVLAGIARATVLRVAHAWGWRTREVEADRQNLEEVSGLMLTNSLIGVLLVDRLDDAITRSHPMAERLSEAFRGAPGNLPWTPSQNGPKAAP